MIRTDMSAPTSGMATTRHTVHHRSNHQPNVHSTRRINGLADDNHPPEEGLSREEEKSRAEALNFTTTPDMGNVPSITASHYTLDEVLHLATQREQYESEFPNDMKPNRLLLLDEVNRDAGIMTMLERIKDAQRAEQRETRNPSKRRRFSSISQPSTPQGRNSRMTGAPIVNRITFDGVERTITLSRPRRYILSTSSIWHRIWQVLITVAAVVSGILVPILSCGLSALPALVAVEVACDVVFMFDIVVNFRTSYEDQVRDVFVTSPRHIAQKYACSWLAIDLLHSLPMAHMVSVMLGDDALFSAKGDANSRDLGRHVVVSLRMLKTLRLLRLMFPRYPSINRLNSIVHPASIVLFRLIIDLSFVWHITACIYIYVTSIGFDATRGETDADFYFQRQIPWLPPPGVQNTTEALYLFAVWWAVGVSCSIHRPDPQTYVQLIFSLSVTVAGIFLMTLLIGSLTTAIAEIQSINNQTTYKLQMIARYMHAKKLPHDLRARILSYYRFLLLSMNLLDESSILPGLPRALRMQVSFMVHEPGFVKLSMFWVLKLEEIYFLCQRLKPCILLILDQIIKEGRVGIGLCIVEKGQVEVTRRGDFVTLLPDSTAFGENALEGKPSYVTVRASRYCELAILLTADYHDLCLLNPAFAKYLKVYVAERDSKHLNPEMKAMALKAVVASSRTKIAHGWTQPTSDMENMIAWQRAAHRAQVVSSVTRRFETVCDAVRRSSSRRSPSRRKPTSTFHPSQKSVIARDTTRTGRLKGVRRPITEWANGDSQPSSKRRPIIKPPLQRDSKRVSQRSIHVPSPTTTSTTACDA